VGIGGADLGGQALRAGIVDVLTLVLFPVIIGSGLRVIPAGLRLDLELVERRDFSRGIVQLTYRVPAGEFALPV
jgi:dihydrofolate reductase